MNKKSTTTLAGFHLLIVEDEEINRFVLDKLLRASGCDFTFSGSGEEALIQSRNAAFDVILMDIELPGMNGYETAIAIRKNQPEGSKHPLLIAMTGHQQPDEHDKITACGMNGWIVKPFGLDQLTTTILRTAARPGGSKPIGQFMINLHLLESIAGDDPGFVQLCIELFLKEMPVNLDRLNTAIEITDWETMRTTSHKMKSSFNYMGMTEQRLAAANIEKLAREKRDIGRILLNAKLISEGCKQAFHELNRQV